MKSPKIKESFGSVIESAQEGGQSLMNGLKALIKNPIETLIILSALATAGGMTKMYLERMTEARHDPQPTSSASFENPWAKYDVNTLKGVIVDPYVPVDMRLAAQVELSSRKFAEADISSNSAADI